MLETAIIGGGLCGLALARSLHRQGRSFALFEARSRLGGRILSVTCARSGAAIDLGPTWFWPETQPLVTGLIAELGLSPFPQHDEGALLHLREADKTPDVMDDKPVHNGAQRLEGGMARLVDALAKDLPRDCLYFDHVLTGVHDAGDHVALTFRSGDRLTEIAARQVVIALPPRLAEEHIRFAPDLDEATRTALREADTWMAAQAKVTIAYDRPSWREVGQSGSAFVTHEQAVVGEIFDACDATASKAALGGFVALSPELRQSFSAGLPMLMASQMVQVFGSALEHGEQHYRDWATEPFTCSTRDRAAPRTDHVDFSNPLLRRALWNGKLHFGGSETASHGAGYLEGALDAARRIQRAIGRAGDSTTPVENASTNAASLTRFSAWVAAQSEAAFDKYHRRLNRSLAAQRKQQLTQWAILESVEEIYGEALGVLDELRFDMSAVAVERGRSALMPDVQKPFRDLMQSLFDDVIAFNRTSCALSNFPDEHHPSKEYIQTILRDIAAAWQEFSLSANRLLLAKTETTPGRRPQAGAVTGMSL